VNQPDDITSIIVDAAKKAIQQTQQRCTEALKALDQQDYLAALGAIVGIDDQTQQVTARLLVLRDVAEHKKKNK
jgi:hypothetical protein